MNAEPTGEGVDLETEAGVLTFCEIVQEEMREQFLRDGQLVPFISAFVLATCEMPPFEPGAKLTGPGPKLPQIEPIPCPLRDGGPLSVVAQVYALKHGRTDVEQIEKDMWVHSVRQLIIGTAATAVVFMAESWYMEAQGEPPPKGRAAPDCRPDREGHEEGNRMNRHERRKKANARIAFGQKPHGRVDA